MVQTQPQWSILSAVKPEQMLAAGIEPSPYSFRLPSDSKVYNAGSSYKELDAPGDYSAINYQYERYPQYFDQQTTLNQSDLNSDSDEDSNSTTGWINQVGSFVHMYVESSQRQNQNSANDFTFPYDACRSTSADSYFHPSLSAFYEKSLNEKARIGSTPDNISNIPSDELYSWSGYCSPPSSVDRLYMTPHFSPVDSLYSPYDCEQREQYFDDIDPLPYRSTSCASSIEERSSISTLSTEGNSPENDIDYGLSSENSFSALRNTDYQNDIPTTRTASTLSNLLASPKASPAKSASKGPYFCGHENEDGKCCRRKFTRIHDLQRHYRTMHEKSRKIYKCKLCVNCNRTFTRPDALKRHLRSKMHRSDGNKVWSST